MTLLEKCWELALEGLNDDTVLSNVISFSGDTAIDCFTIDSDLLADCEDKADYAGDIGKIFAVWSNNDGFKCSGVYDTTEDISEDYPYLDDDSELDY